MCSGAPHDRFCFWCIHAAHIYSPSIINKGFQSLWIAGMQKCSSKPLFKFSALQQRIFRADTFQLSNQNQCHWLESVTEVCNWVPFMQKETSGLMDGIKSNTDGKLVRHLFQRVPYLLKSCAHGTTSAREKWARNSCGCFPLGVHAVGWFDSIRGKRTSSNLLSSNSGGTLINRLVCIHIHACTHTHRHTSIRCVWVCMFWIAARLAWQISALPHTVPG